VRSEPDPIWADARSGAQRLLSHRAVLPGAAAAVVLVAGAVLFAPGAGSGTYGSATVARELVGARASLERVDGHAELRLAGMPPPPVGEVYEIWLSGPRPGVHPTNALFNVTSAGTAAVEVPGSLRGVREITVTAEPVGGSSQPTSPVILSVALPGGRGPG